MNPGELGGGFSGTYDGSFPADRVHAAIAHYDVEIDIVAFDAVLGRHLGTYRFLSAAEKNMPAVGGELSQTAKLIASIDEVRTGFANLPPKAGALMEEFRWKRSGGAELFFQLWQRTEAGLEEVRMLLLFAEKELGECTGRVGRRRAGLRDGLLYDIAILMLDAEAPTMRAAVACAAEVLRVCGVPVPDDVRDAERIFREQRKLRNKGEK